MARGEIQAITLGLISLIRRKWFQLVKVSVMFDVSFSWLAGQHLYLLTRGIQRLFSASKSQRKFKLAKQIIFAWIWLHVRNIHLLICHWKKISKFTVFNIPRLVIDEKFPWPESPEEFHVQTHSATAAANVVSSLRVHYLLLLPWNFFQMSAWICLGYRHHPSFTPYSWSKRQENHSPSKPYITLLCELEKTIQSQRGRRLVCLTDMDPLFTTQTQLRQRGRKLGKKLLKAE